MGSRRRSGATVRDQRAKQASTPTLSGDNLCFTDTLVTDYAFLKTDKGKRKGSISPFLFFKNTRFIENKDSPESLYSFLPSGAKSDIPLSNRMPNLFLFLL